MTRFCIATPCYSNLYPWYADSLQKTICNFGAWSKYTEWIPPFRYLSGTYIEHARFCLASDIKRDYPDYDGILWIDADMGWSVEDVNAVTKNKDVATGALYMSRREDGMVGKVIGCESIKETIEKAFRDEVLIPSYLGFGFIYTPLSYFPDEEMPWFQLDFKRSLNSEGGGFSGEDLHWCRNQHLAGRKVYAYVSPENTVVHAHEPGPRGLQIVNPYDDISGGVKRW